MDEDESGVTTIREGKSRQIPIANWTKAFFTLHFPDHYFKTAQNSVVMSQFGHHQFINFWMGSVVLIRRPQSFYPATTPPTILNEIDCDEHPIRKTG